MDAPQLGPLLVAEVPGLLRFALTLSRGGAQAEDLVQETLVRALERASTFRGEASLATWLHRVMHNLAVDESRRDRSHRGAVQPGGSMQGGAADVGDPGMHIESLWQEDSYTVDAAVVVARAETREEVQDALLHLPLIYRAAVVLHDAEGLTVREIAEIQSIGLPAAKQRLRRGRMMLVTELAQGYERRIALRGVPLRCWDARSQVSDFLDGELQEAGVTRLSHHLEACPTCPPLYAALAAGRATLAAPTPRGGEVTRDPDTVIPSALALRVAAVLAEYKAP